MRCQPLEGNLTSRTFLLLLFSITLGSFGQICLKVGMTASKAAASTQPDSLAGTLISLLGSMAQPYVLLGLALYIISTITWLLLLSKVRLSVAYPMISISYVFVVILSAILLKENVAWSKAVPGLLLISGGVSFIGLGLGRMPGKQPASSGDQV